MVTYRRRPLEKHWAQGFPDAESDLSMWKPDPRLVRTRTAMEYSGYVCA